MENISKEKFNIFNYYKLINTPYSPFSSFYIKELLKNNMKDEDLETFKYTIQYSNISTNKKDFYFKNYNVRGLFTIAESAFYLSKDQI